jgi:hypothetical protein
MTREQRAERIKALTHELSALLAQEPGGPRPPVKILTAWDLPSWVAEGLRQAIQRKCAEETPTTH